MFDPARVERLRKGHADEDDRDGARYLVEELKSSIIRGARDPTGSHGTRYRSLYVALQTTTERLGIRFRLPHDSLGSLVKANPGLATMPQLLRSGAVNAPFEPLLDALDAPADRQLLHPVGLPLTNWETVDAEIEELRRNAAGAASGHDRAAVGRLCREVFVSLAHAAYDDSRHGPLPEPREGQGGGTVKPRLEAVIATEASGTGLADLRSLMRKSLAFANTVQHRKNPSDIEIMVCADATIFVASAVRRLCAAG